MKSIAIFIAAVFLSSASAYCPNLCSGHGTCSAMDRCQCYKYTGTNRGDYSTTEFYAGQEAWTGADCSLRTCPYAYAWSGPTPSGLASAGTGTFDADDKIVTVSGYVYSGTDKALFTGAKVRVGTALFTVHSAADNGGTDTDITIFEDASGASGTTYLEQDGSTALAGLGAHSKLECAGQGICDRTTGECECFPGYEGEACTRSVCPNSCSGHGICLAAHRFFADVSEQYDEAWDNNKHYGCKCDSGFRGPDCSLQECPSDFDPLHGCGGGACNAPSSTYTSGGVSTNCDNFSDSDCTSNEQRDCSGRGICDYDTGICRCFSGFYGEACNDQTILI